MAAKSSKSKPQRGHARAKTDVWHQAFVEALRVSGNVRIAAQAAGVDRSTASKRRKSDADFALAWDDAIEDAVDQLEAEAWRRGYEGIEKPITVAGEREVVREYSDTVLITLLKANRPAKYRERFEHTGADGGPIQVEHDASAALLTRLERLAGGDKPG